VRSSLVGALQGGFTPVTMTVVFPAVRGGAPKPNPQTVAVPTGARYCDLYMIDVGGFGDIYRGGRGGRCYWGTNISLDNLSATHIFFDILLNSSVEPPAYDHLTAAWVIGGSKYDIGLYQNNFGGMGGSSGGGSRGGAGGGAGTELGPGNPGSDMFNGEGGTSVTEGSVLAPYVGHGGNAGQGSEGDNYVPPGDGVGWGAGAGSGIYGSAIPGPGGALVIFNEVSSVPV
jgi:hypothetical protein